MRTVVAVCGAKSADVLQFNEWIHRICIWRGEGAIGFPNDRSATVAKTKSPIQTKKREGAPPSGFRKKARVIGAAVFGLVALSAGGTYFAMSGAHASDVAEAPQVSGEIPVPMPVAPVAAAVPVRADDYKIVSIFGDEAILMTGTNLVRVKAGSTAPGLGTITAIDATSDGGGSVVATEATLRAL